MAVALTSDRNQKFPEYAYRFGKHPLRADGADDDGAPSDLGYCTSLTSTDRCFGASGHIHATHADTAGLDPLAGVFYGAGKGAGSVFYVTVGTGVGGGLVIGGKLHGAGRPAVAEIGHLRPGLHEDRPELTVESLCSGPAIAQGVARPHNSVAIPRYFKRASILV